jgi:hypothetical protein
MIDPLRSHADLSGIKSNVVVASTLTALTIGGVIGEAVVSAESAETHCEAPVPLAANQLGNKTCAERPVVLEAWSPDMPEYDNAAHAPPAQLDEISGTAPTNSLPFFGGIDDTSALRRHHAAPRHATVFTGDDSAGWLHAAIYKLRPSQTVQA